MKEPCLDPALESLAARLAAHSPRLSAAEAQQLLYWCAFAAGQSAAARSTRRWQGLAAALAVLLVAVGLPIAFRQPTAVPNAQAALAPAEPHSATALAAAPDIDRDAWQQQADSSTFLEQGLQRFGQIDPALRSFAAASLSHSLVE